MKYMEPRAYVIIHGKVVDIIPADVWHSCSYNAVSDPYFLAGIFSGAIDEFDWVLSTDVELQTILEQYRK